MTFHGRPWSCPGTCGYGQHAVLQWAHTEGQGLSEVNSSATLDLVGSKQFMLSPSAVILLKVVPCSLPVPAAQGLISTWGLWWVGWGPPWMRQHIHFCSCRCPLCILLWILIVRVSMGTHWGAWIPDCYMRTTVSSCSTIFNCWIISWPFRYILWSLNRRTNLQAQRVLNDAIKIQISDWLEENLMRGSWVYPAIPALSGPVWGIILVSDPEICFTRIAVAMAVHFWQRYYSLIRDNTKEFRF